MALLWGIVGIITPILLGIAVALIALPNATANEFIVARICLSLTALMLSVATVIWELKANAPFVGKLAVGCSIGFLVFVAFPISVRWVNGRWDAAHPTGLKIVITLKGVNEEKDIVASSDGAMITLFNDSPKTLNIRKVLRFPTLKSSDVLDKYKDRAGIPGGGKPGSDYAVFEIPGLPPGQHVVFEVAFAEKQKITSIDAWKTEYGYVGDDIKVDQGFLAKEQRP